MQGSRFTALFAVITLAAVPASAQAGNTANEVLSNESITQMITGKVPKDIILTKIRTTKNSFDLTPSGLVGLQANKVGGDVIKVMMQSAATAPKETLNNDAVIQMVNGQLSKDIIVLKIQGSKADYDLSTNGIIRLNQSKVSQDVIKSMMAASSGTAAPPKKP